MKHLYLSVLTVLALPAVAFAQSKVDPEAEKAVTKIEQDLSAALMKNDAAALDPVVAAEAFFVAPDGDTQTKAEFLADVKSGDLKLQQNQLSEMKVQAADADMAVVTYRSVDKGSYKGEDISGSYRWMDVFVKRDGKWLLVTSQGTPIGEGDKKP